MSLDVLLITPPSRLEVYQKLASEFAAIEPPVWSSLIAKYLAVRGYNVKILDAEAEFLTHKETADIIIKDTKLIKNILSYFFLFSTTLILFNRIFMSTLLFLVLLFVCNTLSISYILKFFLFNMTFLETN